MNSDPQIRFGDVSVERVDDETALRLVTGIPLWLRLCLAYGAESRLLVPFVPAICTTVDLDAGVLELVPPSGLLDLATVRLKHLSAPIDCC